MMAESYNLARQSGGFPPDRRIIPQMARQYKCNFLKRRLKKRMLFPAWPFSFCAKLRGGTAPESGTIPACRPASAGSAQAWQRGRNRQSFPPGPPRQGRGPRCSGTSAPPTGWIPHQSAPPAKWRTHPEAASAHTRRRTSPPATACPLPHPCPQSAPPAPCAAGRYGEFRAVPA